MTNLQEASNLISDILDLKLGVGDIVEGTISKDEYTILKVEGIEYLGWSDKYGEQWHPKSLLKLKQRNITLPMVLECLNQCKNIVFYEFDQLNEDLPEMMALTIHLKDKTKVEAEWQLRKDGKDLSLFDQKNETIKFVIEVLK